MVRINKGFKITKFRVRKTAQVLISLLAEDQPAIANVSSTITLTTTAYTFHQNVFKIKMSSLEHCSELFHVQ